MNGEQRSWAQEEVKSLRRKAGSLDDDAMAASQAAALWQIAIELDRIADAYEEVHK